MSDTVPKRERLPDGLPPASGIVAYLLLLSGVAAVFGAFPTLDLWISEQARAVSGGAFLPTEGWWYWLYAAARPAIQIVGLLVIALGLFNLLTGKRYLRMSPRAAVFLLLTLAIIQGLIIDVYLKGYFGRARPRDIEAFGGDLTFTAFYLISDQCNRNCSFVSGHAGMAYFYLAFGFLWPPGRVRYRIFGAAILFGLIMGWMRVIQGGHFASDVLFSGLVVFGATWLLALLILQPGWLWTWCERQARGLLALVGLIKPVKTT